MPKCVVIAAADTRLRAELAVGLKAAGYAIELASTGARALDLTLAHNVYAAILASDLIEEISSRFHELRARVRKLILLDARSNAGRCRVAMGSVADAVISQPLELASVLPALRDPAENPPQEPELFICEAGTLDGMNRTFRDAAGREIVLTRAEFNLLHALARNAGRVLSREQLIHATSGRRAEPQDRSIDMLVSRVRRKIELDPRVPRLLIAVPGLGYRFGMPVERRPAAAFAYAAPPLSIQERPSIAVLPFENLSPASVDNYFAEGVVDDIITSLSLLPWLFVIARGSSFTFKGENTDPYQAGTELGVRYILQGTVRRSGHQMRITGRLIDLASGRQLWAERFDGSIEDVFRLQHQVASGVVGAVGVKLPEVEIERMRHNKTENLGAYDYFLRGLAGIHAGMWDGVREPLQMFYKAIELDANFATAYGLASRCYVWRKANGWMSDPTAEVAETARLVDRIAIIGKDDPVALSCGGFALAYVLGEIAPGGAMVERALALAPGLAEPWGWSAWVNLYRGEPRRAIEHAAQAMQLSPRDPSLWAREIVTGFGHYLMAHYEEAAAWAERAFLTQPRFPAITRLLAASHAMGGRLRQAHQALERARTRGVDAIVPLSTLGSLNPLRPPDLERYKEGLRKAGFPE